MWCPVESSDTATGSRRLPLVYLWYHPKDMILMRPYTCSFHHEVRLNIFHRFYSLLSATYRFRHYHQHSLLCTIARQVVSIINYWITLMYGFYLPFFFAFSLVSFCCSYFFVLCLSTAIETLNLHKSNVAATGESRPGTEQRIESGKSAVYSLLDIFMHNFDVWCMQRESWPRVT